MKNRPILFSGPMVRAILQGRKTMTRRIMKPVPAYPDSFFMKRIEIHGNEARFFRRNAENPAHIFHCPCGAPGDRLWVRETWRIADSDLCGCGDSCCTCGCNGQPIYAASIKNDLDYYSPWRPSIHMPRWASRIILEITVVRVERLQNITVDDCMAEGIDCDKQISNPDPKTHKSIEHWNLTHAQYLYKELWDSLNGKRPGCAWADNPWVWVVEFERVS